MKKLILFFLPLLISCNPGSVKNDIPGTPLYVVPTGESDNPSDIFTPEYSIYLVKEGNDRTFYLGGLYNSSHQHTWLDYDGYSDQNIEYVNRNNVYQIGNNEYFTQKLTIPTYYTTTGNYEDIDFTAHYGKEDNINGTYVYTDAPSVTPVPFEFRVLPSAYKKWYYDLYQMGGILITSIAKPKI